MSSTPFPPPLLSSADIQLDRDIFLRALLRELSGTLENVVGLDDASGFISVVGQRVGEWIEAEYRAVLGSSQMDREQVTAVLNEYLEVFQGVASLEDWVTVAGGACFALDNYTFIGRGELYVGE